MLLVWEPKKGHLYYAGYVAYLDDIELCVHQWGPPDAWDWEVIQAPGVQGVHLGYGPGGSTAEEAMVACVEGLRSAIGQQIAYWSDLEDQLSPEEEV